MFRMFLGIKMTCDMTFEKAVRFRVLNRETKLTNGMYRRDYERRTSTGLQQMRWQFRNQHRIQMQLHMAN